MNEHTENTPYPQAFTERYEIIECLSSTQQGETLLVLGKADDAYYVAKRMDGETDAEAELLQRLSHPSLPKYAESISLDCEHILIREYMKGTPLDAYIRERPLSDRQIVDVGIQLCDVLTYLHTQDPPIIHRDVKPQNVIMGENGRVTLIDFGIARIYKPDARKDTVFSGTNDFAPPEQYGFSQTDARADVFSLGMLLKFLLTCGDMDAAISDKRLARVVKRCTAFAPDRRYRSAALVKKALLLYNNRTPVRIAVIAAVALALAASFLLGWHTPTPEEIRAQKQAIYDARSPEEYARAKEYGFVPSALSDKNPDTTVVTWAQYCDMLGTMIAQYDDTLLPEWEKMTADAPETEMHRDGGMVALLFAGELMGIDRFNAASPGPFLTYAPKVWRVVTMDYPVFHWNQYKMIDEGCYDDNYVGPAYDYCVRRVSNVTGKSLLLYDLSGDLRLEAPFTLREAGLSVIRLYESTVK